MKKNINCPITGLITILFISVFFGCCKILAAEIVYLGLPPSNGQQAHVAMEKRITIVWGYRNVPTMTVRCSGIRYNGGKCIEEKIKY